jgi:hypothetical protein
VGLPGPARASAPADYGGELWDHLLIVNERHLRYPRFARSLPTFGTSASGTSASEILLCGMLLAGQRANWRCRWYTRHS